jgi:putative transposase
MEHRKNQRYSEEFKLKIVKEVLSGQLSNAEAKQKYSLGGNSDASKWLGYYKKYGVCTLSLVPKPLFVKEKAQPTRPTKLHPQVGLSRVCRLLGLTRQAYYQSQWRLEADSTEAELVIQQVHAIKRLHPAIGCRKLLVMLQAFLLDHQIKMGRDALFDLLAAHKLLVRKRKRNIVTTWSKHWMKKYPNLVRDIIPSAINEVWVSDITYFKMADKHVYISFITDAYSRKIVGYHVADTLEAVHTVQALKMALKGINTNFIALIHHSDRGVQYCSAEYVKLLQDHGIAISMTENGDPLENAIAERVNGIIKEEYLNHYQIKTKKEIEQKLQKAVSLYNNGRPHLSCNMLTPDQVHESKLTPQRLWKNYYKKPIIVNVKQDYPEPVNQ